MEPNFVTIILWWTIYIFLSDRSAPIQYGHHRGTLFNIGPYGKHFANFLFSETDQSILVTIILW